MATITQTGDDPGTQFATYGASVRYAMNTGLIVLPAMGPVGTPAVPIQLFAPYQIKIIDWLATRPGAKPKPPSPDTGSANDILMMEFIGLAMISDLPDGSPLWSMSGQYVYGMISPISNSDMISGGLSPLSGLSMTQTQISLEQFAGGVFTAAPVSGGTSIFPFTSEALQGILTGQPTEAP